MESEHSFGSRVEAFLTSVAIRERLPRGFEVLHPYTRDEVRKVVHEMCTRFYAVGQTRVAVWGINPGRFGAGITGLSFTDPHALKHVLGIASILEGRREISAEFIQGVIESYGGAERFFADVYLTALCPLGFVRNGVNINFYDDIKLQQRLTPGIVSWVKQQIGFGVRTDNTMVLGTGKLKQFFEKHVREQCGFQHVTYLEHPRYIMQYRRKERPKYVRLYVENLQRIVQQAL